MSDLSYGLWKVTNALDTKALRNSVVELRLSARMLTVEQQNGAFGVTWPVAGSSFKVFGPFRGYLVFGADRIWIESTEGRHATDLADAITERQAAPGIDGEPPSNPVVVFSYPGRTQVEAGEAFAQHSEVLTAKGYAPMAQSWAEGRPGVGRVMMLGLAANSIRPKGFLTVTYKRVEQASAEPQAPALDPIDQIRRLGQLRDAGFVTPEEFEAKKAELLARM